jgi:hypothetical protein
VARGRVQPRTFQKIQSLKGEAKMNATLKLVNDELVQLVTSLKAIGSNEPFSLAHSAWNAPGTTRDELVESVDRLLALISSRGVDQLPINEALIADYPRRLAFLRVNTVPQLLAKNAAQAVPAFLITVQSLSDALEKALPEDQDLAASIALQRANARTATTRLRALEAQISEMEPRASSLNEMVSRIERANAAADQLPIDLESLSEAQKTIAAILERVQQNQTKIGVLATDANTDKVTLAAKVKEAEEIVARCSAAYAASTSHGLAAAFTERSSALAKSMWVWVVGLVIALGLGSWIGSTQLRNFSELLKQPAAEPTVAAINLVLALLSVGATVWFSWVATKQIGQRFRLAEDYAFKASVSRAYEGYRREAANIDEEFVARLFSSALSRLDEQPLRLVEATTHGSPWHELASSDVVRKATDVVPDFANFVVQLAKDGLAALKPASKVVIAEKSSGNTE